jgi:DNA repair exonuclease SbcCD ATPase subunit
VLGELAAAAARDEDQRALLAALDGKGGGGVTLAQLSEEKTQHKVAELRLRRRLEAVEQSEAREAEAARVACAAREAAEEELVRAQERARMVEREAGEREARLASEAAALRAQLSQAQLEAVARRRPTDAPPTGAPPPLPPPALPLSADAFSPLGDWPGGGDASAGVAARAVVLELQAQLSSREAELADLRSDLASAVTELAQARAELAAEGENLARKEALLAELHAAHTAEARAMAEGGASSAEAAIAAAAGAGARQSRLAAVAQQTIAGLHAKVRKHEETESALRRMLEAGREALRNEKAAAAAEAEKLSERLYQFQRKGLQELEGALRMADEMPPPRAADGLELSGAQVEELLIEKDEAIARLQVEAEAAGHEVVALRAHLQEQLAEVERLGGALEAERRREPTSAMHAQLAQVRGVFFGERRGWWGVRERDRACLGAGVVGAHAVAGEGWRRLGFVPAALTPGPAT